METLEARGILKSFPGMKALDGVDLTLRRGEIHALMGENGAGKSTLIKVLTGFYTPEAGELHLNGKRIRPRKPREAQKLGISTVYQEVNLIPTLSVAENIYLGREPLKFGFIQTKKIREGARRALARLNLHIDVSQTLSSFSIATQQMIAIARALDISADVLILDEPTSSLDESEVRQLFTVMRKLRSEGLAILFVTHFMDQVYELSDRITVLRNGRLVGEYLASELPRVALIEKMMGRKLASFEAETPVSVTEPKVVRSLSDNKTTQLVRAKGLSRSGCIEAFDLSLAPGEIVGLAGLLGSGRSEIARLFFGVDRKDGGTLNVAGMPTAMSSPREAMRLGFALLPEDRKTQAIIPDLSIRENIILALQAKRGWLRPLSWLQQSQIVTKYMKALNIVAASTEQAVNTLSGGNQQKVILARWLASTPKLLILDEPTRGIDVGAKAEIQSLILDLAKAGMAVLFISSELEEAVRICHRVAVLRDRKVLGELTGGDIRVGRIVEAIAKGIA